MTHKLGHLVDSFMRIYGLSPSTAFDNRHEGIHAITGLGIGGADEMRVSAVMQGVIKHSFTQACHEHEELYDFLAHRYYHGLAKGNAVPGRFETLNFQLAQRHLDPLSKDEIRAFHTMGGDIERTVHTKIRQGYYNTPYPTLAQLDFAEIDFSEKATALKLAFQSAKNRRIARLCTNMLAQESVRQTGVSLIPAADKPWTSSIHKM